MLIFVMLYGILDSFAMNQKTALLSGESLPYGKRRRCTAGNC